MFMQPTLDDFIWTATLYWLTGKEAIFLPVNLLGDVELGNN